MTIIVFAAMLIVVNLVLHEAAHVAAMKQNGIRIAYLQLGAYKPYGTVRSRWLDFPIRISPWLVAAKIQLLDKQSIVKRYALPYREQAWIIGAGSVAHFLFGGGLLVLAQIAALLTASAKNASLAVAVAVVTAAVMAATWRYRKAVCAYIAPVVGCVVVILFLLVVLFAWIVTASVQAPAPPPNGITAWADHPVALTLAIGGIATISWAFVNVVPVYSNDGTALLMATFKLLWGSKGEHTAARIGLIVPPLSIAAVLLLITQR